MAAGKIDVCNRALQILGVKRLASLEEDSKNAKECLACYDMLRRAELQRNIWVFAVTRQILTATGVTPEFGRTYQFNLPATYLREVPLDQKLSVYRGDILREGRTLITSDPGPLYVRFVQDVEDVTQFDPMFAEGLAARMAEAMCEPLTQSNTKQVWCERLYDRAMNDARRSNAIENGPIEVDEDDLVTVRF